MKDSEFTKLLKKTAKAAHIHKELGDKVAEECEARYGCSYSDIDADGLIDTLDYQGSIDGKSLGENINSRWFDKQMKNSGAERIDKNGERVN